MDKKSTSNYKIIALVVILLAGLGLLFKKKVANQSTPTLTAPATNPSDNQNPMSAPETSNQETSAGSIQESITERSKKGLCDYSDKLPDERLISLEVVNFIIQKKPDFILLPSFHGECLNSQDIKQFRIVSYDPGTDLAYEYWGTIQFTPRVTHTYVNMQDLLYSNEFTLKNSGFKDEKEIYKFLGSLGMQANDSIVLVNISDVRNLAIRKPTGSYSFYPGARIIFNSDLQNLPEKTQWIDIRYPPPKEKLENALSMDMRGVETFSISAPALNTAREIPKEIQDVENEKSILLVGNSLADRRPYNLLPALRRASPSRAIYILGDGYAGTKGINLETPESIPGLKVLSVKELETKVNSVVLLDTRPLNSINDLFVKSAWITPILLPIDDPSTLADLSQYHTNFHFTKKYHLEHSVSLKAIKFRGTKRPVVIIGQNDHDWRPIVMFAKLKKTGLEDISWVREGIDGIILSEKLGLIGPGLREKSMDLKTGTTKIVEVPNAKKNEAKKVAVTEPPKSLSNRILHGRDGDESLRRKKRMKQIKKVREEAKAEKSKDESSPTPNSSPSPSHKPKPKKD